MFKPWRSCQDRRVTVVIAIAGTNECCWYCTVLSPRWLTYIRGHYLHISHCILYVLHSWWFLSLIVYEMMVWVYHVWSYDWLSLRASCHTIDDLSFLSLVSFSFREAFTFKNLNMDISFLSHFFLICNHEWMNHHHQRLATVTVFKVVGLTPITISNTKLSVLFQNFNSQFVVDHISLSFVWPRHQIGKNLKCLRKWCNMRNIKIIDQRQRHAPPRVVVHWWEGGSEQWIRSAPSNR